MRLLTTTVLLLSLAAPALAGEFSTSGQRLDDQLRAMTQSIQELYTLVDGLNGRIEALEEGSAPEPCRVAAVDPDQSPLVPHCLPGRIEAEDYDLGGEGVAYHDSDDVNSGGLYRDDQGVDITATGDESGEFQVGWNNDGEWLEYTVKAEAGVYDARFRVTCGIAEPLPCGRIRVILDGMELGVVQVPNTGSWGGPYETVVLECFKVRAGNQILRLEMLDTWLDLNWIEFELRDEPGNDPPCDVLFGD